MYKHVCNVSSKESSVIYPGVRAGHISSLGRLCLRAMLMIYVGQRTIGWGLWCRSESHPDGTTLWLKKKKKVTLPVRA